METHQIQGRANEAFAYLTTTGRRSGRPHRIEIWFVVDHVRVYLMAGGRDRSDWVRNIQADPRITIEFGNESRAGTATIIEQGTPEDQRARELLVAKYATPANPLADWKVRSLPVVIELAPETITE